MNPKDDTDDMITLIVRFPKLGKEMTRKARKGDTVGDLVDAMELDMDGVLVLCSGVPVPIDTPVSGMDGNEVDIIDVASGG